MAEHFPGPWETREVPAFDSISIARVGYMPHATVFNPGAGGALRAQLSAEDRANAAIMAAAPAMLAALRLAFVALEHSEPVQSHYPEPVARHKAALEAVRAALGEAGGDA